MDDDSAGAYNIYATQLSACKFENDYAQSTPAFIAPATMSGCVIAYNYATNITYSTANYLPEVFNLSHDVPCRGYGLIKKKSKLKNIYSSCPKEELMKMKKEGKGH